MRIVIGFSQKVKDACDDLEFRLLNDKGEILLKSKVVPYES
jgi:hypothetical protein